MIDRNSLPFKDIKRHPYAMDARHRMRIYEERLKMGVAYIENAEKELGLTCTCEKGCDACCRQMITVFDSEAEIVAKYLDDTVKGRKMERLKQKLKEQVEALKKYGITDEAVREVSEKGEEELRMKYEYVALSLPCPLLSEDGCCTVYPVRPVSCWDYRCYGDRTLCEGQINPNAHSNEKISVPLMFDILSDKDDPSTSELRLFQTALLEKLEELDK